MEQITKYDELLARLEYIRFYIRTPEQAAEALLFSKKLKEFAAKIEEKVKGRASEIMSDKDLKFLDIDGFSIIRIEPTDTLEYSASNLIEAIGQERATPFLKVSTSKLQMYIKKQGVSGEELEKINQNVKNKHRDGYIKIIEIKKKDDAV